MPSEVDAVDTLVTAVLTVLVEGWAVLETARDDAEPHAERMSTATARLMGNAVRRVCLHGCWSAMAILLPPACIDYTAHA